MEKVFCGEAKAGKGNQSAPEDCTEAAEVM